jgi:hypothetical protein
MSRLMWLWVVALGAAGCDVLLEDPCDAYVDYLCDCGDPDCAQLRSQLSGADPDVQESCRLEQACFDRADAEGGICVLFDEDRTGECLGG